MWWIYTTLHVLIMCSSLIWIRCKEQYKFSRGDSNYSYFIKGPPKRDPNSQSSKTTYDEKQYLVQALLDQYNGNNDLFGVWSLPPSTRPWHTHTNAMVYWSSCFRILHMNLKILWRCTGLMRILGGIIISISQRSNRLMIYSTGNKLFFAEVPHLLGETDPQAVC
jgi:hypothetical protein